MACEDPRWQKVGEDLDQWLVGVSGVEPSGSALTVL